MGLRTTLACLALVTALAPDASAQPAPSAPATKGWPEIYPRMRWWEYAGGAALLGGSLAIRFAVDISGQPRWQSGLLLDDELYDALMVESPARFRAWRKAGDVGYLASYAWSAADPLIAGLVYDWETALQMTMMNLEAFSAYSMVLSISQLIVRRQRPATRECVDPDHAAALGISCGDVNKNVSRSFIGGHVGTVATAATLTCVHHAHLPLWGSPEADALPCVTWTAMTALVLASRTATGQHHFSDNLLGIVTGISSGLVPWSLHYAFGLWAPEPVSKDALAMPTGVMPVPYDDGLGLQVSGVLF